MALTEIIGIAAGVCTSVASVPQIFTTIKKKKTSDISPFMFGVLLLGNALWAWYGLTKPDLPVAITNIVSVLLDMTMLYLRFKYRSDQ